MLNPSKKALYITIFGVLLTLVALGVGVSYYFLADAPILQKETDAKNATFTLAELATHNSQEDCWTSYGGNVYDVTWFIPTHKGGLQILAQCGQVSDEFSKVHPGGLFSKPSVQAVLSLSKVGTLAK